MRLTVQQVGIVPCSKRDRTVSRRVIHDKYILIDTVRPGQHLDIRRQFSIQNLFYAGLGGNSVNDLFCLFDALARSDKIRLALAVAVTVMHGVPA